MPLNIKIIFIFSCYIESPPEKSSLKIDPFLYISQEKEDVRVVTPVKNVVQKQEEEESDSDDDENEEKAKGVVA